MKLKDFKLIFNRQEKSRCFCYEYRDFPYKYTIFTMDFGQTYLASMEEKNDYNKAYSTLYSENFENPDLAIDYLNQIKYELHGGKM